jgi:hypothetical protein
MRKPRPPGTGKDVFVLDGGRVVSQWPGTLTANEHSDMAGWIKLVLRKAKRSVISGTFADDEDEEEDDDDTDLGGDDDDENE